MVRIAIAVAAVLFAAVTPAAAQSRPLLTEDAETVPAGYILVEAGFDIERGAIYPV